MTEDEVNDTVFELRFATLKPGPLDEALEQIAHEFENVAVVVKLKKITAALVPVTKKTQSENDAE